MTPGPEGPFEEEDEHPVLLPWLAAGTLDGWTARRIEEHAAACADCRRELEALKSMAATLNRHAGSDHVGISELIDFEQSGAALDPDRSEAIRKHLSGCVHCAEELEALRSARQELRSSTSDVPREAPARRASSERRQGWQWAFYAAAAAVVALFVFVPAHHGWRTAQAPAEMREISLVRLAAQTRGEGGGTVLGGPGPWTLEIALPFGAPAGEYQVRLVSGVPGSGISWSARAHASADSRLSVYLPSRMADGQYLLTATSSVESGKSYEYPLTRSASAQ